MSIHAKDVTLKDIIEKDDPTKDSSLQEEPTEIGKTPLSTALALHMAAQNHDWATAVKYVDFRYLPASMKDMPPEEIIRKLAIVWGQQNIVDFSMLSDNPKGHTTDGLPSYRDLLGEIKTKEGTLPIFLQLVPDGEGSKIWKVSNASVALTPALWAELGYHPLAISLSKYLPNFTILHMQNWQFVSVIIILIFGWYATALLRWVLLILVARSKTYKDTMHRFIRVPLRMSLFFFFFEWCMGQLGLSLSARIWFDSGIFHYLATIFISLGVIEFTFAFFISRTENKKQTLAILRPLVTVFKIIVIFIIVLDWFEEAGYSIATILTGLGIGSLALALAAQKTLENVFGAFTLYISRPIKVGNFCKFGDITGTVEEIGLRATRIRKLDRSVVHVPNSVFASSNVENFSEIDRRHFNHNLHIQLNTRTAEIKLLLIELRKLLISHSKVLDTAARARFESIERDAFIITINCYVQVKTIEEFKAVIEDLNLHILDILDRLNINLAMPSQQLFMSRAEPHSVVSAENAQVIISKLDENSESPFPDFTTEEKQTLKNTLDYPRKGSVDYQVNPLPETAKPTPNV